jgi:hypothetical protein
MVPFLGIRRAILLKFQCDLLEIYYSRVNILHSEMEEGGLQGWV